LSNVRSLFDLVAINFKNFINSLQASQEVWWWVALGAVGQNKMCCKCWLVCRVAALFILRSVGILSVPFSVRVLLVVSSFSMTGNVIGVGIGATFETLPFQSRTKGK
jgi:hypothetical protein